MPCCFNACLNDAMPGGTKCSFHKSRRRCEEPGCHNQVFARNRCVRHGGKRQCSHDGCTANVRRANVCARHGALSAKRLCLDPGCTNVAHRNKRCIRHGGRRDCRVTGCETHARSGGYCWKHRRTPLSPATTSKSDSASSMDTENDSASDDMYDIDDDYNYATSDAETCSSNDVDALDEDILLTCLSLSVDAALDDLDSLDWSILKTIQLTEVSLSYA
ncbi:hypothetical protein ACHHYP_03061 [Achlya hypogyna]|uniref:Uncharacterized protein n=1 Tax=Achlya hypogyna TaxID=1202772 RepID=A0A1V9Z539_ACHHY|nr:hypothetical protein ACHHYP_03061 [Achlya hypogyna]